MINVTVTLYITLIPTFKFGREMPTLLISLAVSAHRVQAQHRLQTLLVPAGHSRSLDTVTLCCLSQIISNSFFEMTSRHLLATAAVRGVAWLNIICSVSKFLVIPYLSEPYISIQSSQHLTGINLMGKENLSDVALYNSRKSTASNSIH